MKTRRFFLLATLSVVGLLAVGCDDSKHPLSDPNNSKPDARLAGVWRARGNDGEVTYYHFGRPGDKLPESVMRLVEVKHSKEGKIPPTGEFLIFPTTLGNSAYLNLTDGKEEQIKRIEENGWKPESMDSFILFKYKIEGDTLLAWGMDGEAKKRAIESKKIQGTIEKQDSGEKVRFTDTTENLARFVAGAGDSLWSKDVLRLERVK